MWPPSISMADLKDVASTCLLPPADPMGRNISRTWTESYSKLAQMRMLKPIAYALVASDL